MSSVHNVRNKFDCLQAIIYSLYYEEGECPTAGKIADFPGCTADQIVDFPGCTADQIVDFPGCTADQIVDFPGCTADQIVDFPGVHCGINRRFFRHALQSRLNSNQTKLNAD